MLQTYRLTKSAQQTQPSHLLPDAALPHDGSPQGHTPEVHFGSISTQTFERKQDFQGGLMDFFFFFFYLSVSSAETQVGLLGEVFQEIRVALSPQGKVNGRTPWKCSMQLSKKRGKMALDNILTPAQSHLGSVF